MEKELNGDEVIVEIPGGGENTTSNDKDGEIKVDGIFEKQESSSFKSFLQLVPPPAIVQAVPLNQDPGLRARKKVPSFTSSSSTLEIPKVDEDTNRKSLAHSPYPKAKSRLIEPSIPSNWKIANDKNDKMPNASPSQETKTPKVTPPITPKTPLMSSQGDEDGDDDVYFTEVIQANRRRKRSKKIKVLFFIEFSLFFCTTVVLILSRTVNKMERSEIWSLELWKWCVLVLAIFSGRLISMGFTNTVVFMIEKEFLLKKKVLYFVYSLQKSVRIFIWLGLILLSWGLLINHGVRRRRSRRTVKVLNYITRGIASTLVGAGAWVLKTMFVKILASSFHVKVFFDRIQENIFHQYVLQTLSGAPLMGDIESIPSRQMSFKSSTNEGGKQKKKKVIDVQKLQNTKREKVSAWTMRGLIKVVSKSGFSTLSNALEESEDDVENDEQKAGTITCEWEARNAGYAIFRNVAKHKQKYIEEDDLLRFMNIDDVKKVLPLFEGAAKTGKIKKKSFCNWVVNVYKERKFLALSLKDTKTAIEELNKLVSGLTLIILIIVWLILMGIATTEVLLFISSQFLLGVFIFGTSAKSAFEAIIFVFVMHPFDVGDRCVVDGVQVVVEEVNILTTVFLRYDNEKIFYPNSILATKAISNFNRSPEMSDSIEFDVDVSTSVENILALKAKIKAIQENIFHQYVLQTLSGAPLMGDIESIPSRQMSFKSSTNEGGKQKKKKVIDVQKLQNTKREKVSAWAMRGLIKVVSKSGFSTLSNALEESEDDVENDEQKAGTITCEWEAQNAGYAIFRNVARHKQKYIEEDDLLRFMNIDDIKKVLPLFEGAAETGKIKKKSFCNWVVNVYKERKFLALSLKDTKTAIEELNKLVSGLTLIILIIVWLILMGIATTEVLLFISSQFLLGVFIFGTSAKSAFEAIIFVFVMHPFDVGDRCVVDGVQVVVEEVNILTTVFLRYDNEKIFYPNSILATKAISNFNRSPEMSDSIEFDVDVSTSVENILALKAKIKAYIDNKPQLWRPKHSVRVREIEDVNKMKMSLYVTHTINFQNHEEKSERRSNLVLELKNIFEEIGIKYHLLPQEVLIRYVDSASPHSTTSTRLL